MNTKIVVITPVKNEAWILERFLSVTTDFADYVIIAEQNSSDNSVSICKSYGEKAIIVENKSKDFNEAERQLLLIQTARDLVPDRKIILALDADEILAANATKTPGWKTMLNAEPGTILYFEKVSICNDTNQCIRYYPFPLGYVDDGAEHSPSKIHSVRIPTPENAPKLVLHDIKILHYLLMRPEAQASKVRFYSVVENLIGKGNPFSRRITYSSNKNYFEEGSVEESNPDWFEGWEKIGIDMRSITSKQYFWYDFEVLEYFQKFGYYRFWLEDIWDFNWEKFRQYAISQGVKGLPDGRVKSPPFLLSLIMRFMTEQYKFLKKVILS